MGPEESNAPFRSYRVHVSRRPPRVEENFSGHRGTGLDSDVFPCQKIGTMGQVQCQTHEGSPLPLSQFLTSPKISSRGIRIHSTSGAFQPYLFPLVAGVVGSGDEDTPHLSTFDLTPVYWGP